MATANLLQTSVSGGTANALALQGDGVFFPKASTASRLALTLTTTDKGFVVYDTTDSNIYFWNGTAWESIPGSGDAGANGSVQYNDNGTVSGASNFSYNKVTSAVSIAGAATVGTTLGVTGKSTLTGNVAVGTTSSPWLAAVSALDIGSSGIAAYSGGITHNAYFDNTDSRWEYKNASSSAAVFLNMQGGEFLFNTAVAGTVGNLITFTQALGINSTGNLVLKGGTAAATGVGVTFPAAQVVSSDANCLDDYEEGVWNPTLAGQLGTTGQTYVTQSGRYTKIGRQVSCNFEVELSAVGTVTGLALISGLPFTSVATGVALNGGTFNIGFANNLATNQIFVAGYLINGNISAFVTAIAAAGTLIGNINATNIWGNTTRISGSINYTAS